MSNNQHYVGRFAPTPSGPLHFGSIVAALSSFLQARKHNGNWLLRIDDLDTPRVQEGATDNIFITLETLKLEWDGNVAYQSHRIEEYESALNLLRQKGCVFRCQCPRKLIKNVAYPGTCRNLMIPDSVRSSRRILTNNKPIRFNDGIQGDYSQDILKHSGDFIVRRSDKIIAYNLAAAIDDTSQCITHVVRGADLIDSTPKQIYIQSLLGLYSPHYEHVPVAITPNGKKISKQYGATDVLIDRKPLNIIIDVLDFLGHPVESGLEKSDINTVMSWALDNWDITRVPRLESIQFNK
ncbi:MAG: glutamyl-Q tRNA(Asp) synthetase [Gammaproteobacteria bacterium]|jgi:glutamyl-Q tRNA(Asp) synthetase